MEIKRKIMKKISSKLRRKNKTPLNKFTKSKRQNKKRKYKTKRRSQKGGVENECGICGEIGNILDENGDIIDDLITLYCRHKFHRSEIIKWCQTISYRLCTCPICRKKITTQDMKQYMPDIYRLFPNRQEPPTELYRSPVFNPNRQEPPTELYRSPVYNPNSQDIPTPAR
jgi:hypothetical protein